jgi:hypothetical protein
MLGNEILYSIRSKRPRVYFTFDDLSAGFDISVWDTSTSSDVQFAYDIFKQGFDRGLWGFTKAKQENHRCFSIVDEMLEKKVKCK